ncbi:hypothetical protein [Gallaecimonas sp. GXIMD4217]|uniref:hypothetical protein n=1 Tax=Gallaecimonas sp. GXIMD4217 TaxID=3131927 RepID=UPI00311B12BC
MPADNGAKENMKRLWLLANMAALPVLAGQPTYTLLGDIDSRFAALEAEAVQNIDAIAFNEGEQPDLWLNDAVRDRRRRFECGLILRPKTPEPRLLFTLHYLGGNERWTPILGDSRHYSYWAVGEAGQ